MQEDMVMVLKCVLGIVILTLTAPFPVFVIFKSGTYGYFCGRQQWQDEQKEKLDGKCS